MGHALDGPASVSYTHLTLPTIVVGSAAVVGAVIAAVIVASRPDVPPLVNGTWGTVRE